MIKTVLVIFLSLFLLIRLSSQEEDDGRRPAEDDDSLNPLAHGYGDDINWVKWEDAIETAVEVKKPIFLLIHKSWCHACQQLKKKMKQKSAMKEFLKFSENFVMVNTEDDEEPWEEEYKPDGQYIPRLLFLSAEGQVLTDIKNPKEEFKDYKYYYSNPADVFNAMKKVANQFGSENKYKESAPAKKPVKKAEPKPPTSVPKGAKKDEKKDKKKEKSEL